MNTLWSVKSRLWELVTLRREMLAEVAFTPEQQAERQAGIAETELAIKAYVCEEIKTNPNSVHQWLLESKARQEDLKAERNRLDGLLAAEEGDYERAKTLVMEVMAEIGEKRLPVRGTLRTQGNGGVRPVAVRQPEMVPDAYKRVSVTMRLDVWRRMEDMFCEPDFRKDEYLNEAEWESVKVGTPEPNLTDIRIALESGLGVAGCELLDRGESLRVA